MRAYETLSFSDVGLTSKTKNCFMRHPSNASRHFDAIKHMHNKVRTHLSGSIQTRSVKDEGRDTSLLRTAFNLMCSFPEWILQGEGRSAFTRR